MYKEKVLLFIKQLNFYHIIYIFMMFVYGFFSTPTPNHIGTPEIIILILLVILIYKNFLKFIKDLFNKKSIVIPKYISIPLILYFIVFLTFYGLVVKENNLSDYIRDFIPFLYFLLPLFLSYFIIKNPKQWIFVLSFGLLISGIGFMFQFYLDPTVKLNQIGFQFMLGQNKDNPWQEPSSVFAFSFFAGTTVYFLLKKSFFKFCFFGAIYLFFLLVYITTISRAPIGLSLITMIYVAWFVVPNHYKNKRLIKFFIIFLIILFILFLYINNVELIKHAFNLLLKKTEHAGILNNRNIEILAVINNIHDIPSLIFGDGWGGLIANPIGNGAMWRFVHNMIFYYIFKTGVLGLLIILIYLYWLLRSVVFIKEINKLKFFYSITFVALFSPLIVAGVLEASYKSLTFGIVMSIFLAYYYFLKKVYYAKTK